MQVPIGCKTAYQNAEYWKNFTNIVEIDPSSLDSKGDANGDGTLNAADIVEIVNYIMNKASENFKFDNADVNDDGVINVADIMIISCIIMKSE